MSLTEEPESGASRLKLVGTVLPASDPNEKLPNVDIIHVVGVDPGRRLGLDTIIEDSVSSRKREYIFQCNITGLLLGDLVWDEIQNEALQLLEGLLASSEIDKASLSGASSFNSHKDAMLSRSFPPQETSVHAVRIFIAYDLGALIVKKAIAMASSRESQWPGIFYSAVQFIYRGCFQRRENIQAFDAKLWAFLQTHKKSALWASLITPSSVRTLAEALVEMTEVFLRSGVTLRTRIISIYTAEDDDEYPAFDFFTATLGISTEFAVQGKPASQDEGVPNLKKMVCYRTSNWLDPPQWIALQRMLLPLALPQSRYTVGTPKSSPRIFEAKAYRDWAASPRSPILYIQGRDESHSRSLADNFCLYEQGRFEKRQDYSTPILTFEFSGNDPLRNNMNSMICSALLQFQSAIASEMVESLPDILVDLCHLQQGWTSKDLQNIFSLLLADRAGTGALFVLYNVDECESSSRKHFWGELQSLLEISDFYFKAVVTSRKRLQLLEDAQESGLWLLYKESEDSLEEVKMLESSTPASLAAHLCPGGYGKHRVNRFLQALGGRDKTELTHIISLIQAHTNWPDDPSSAAWSGFGILLDQVKPTTSPAALLDKILRSVPDKLGLCWVLLWLLNGHRPPSPSELACLLRYCDRGQGYKFLPNPTHVEIRQSLQILRSCISVLAEVNYDKVCIRQFARDILTEDDPSYLWNEIKPMAHQSMAYFLHHYLTTPATQARLDSMYYRYLLSYNAHDDHLMPSVQPDGEDFIYYAITAFPYHLEQGSEFLSQMKHDFHSPKSPLLPWARMYWAMSNPFSRHSVDTLKLPSSILQAANPDTTLLKALERFTVAPYTSTLLSASALEKEGSDDMNGLFLVLSAGNEEAALNYARLMIINGTRENTTEGDAIVETTAVKNINSWPSKALWRAVWLNMARIVRLLLENGTPPDPEDVSSKWFPSPLYLASALGHSQIVKTLLQAEAKTRVQGKGGLGVLQTATAYGHQDIVRALVAKDPGLLEIEQPDTPLDHASIWGKWTTVEVLVELGAQVDFNPSSDGWTPLMVAAYHGHARTVKVLLTKHANPNHPGPGDIYTPLWYAAMHAQSVESVRALLDHGADPNHEILRPPLVCEICASSNICPERKLAILDVLISNIQPLNIDGADSNGKTGLMLAANKGDLPVVEWLIAHNANAGPTTKQSHSALYFAVINGHQQIIQQLLAYGSPINTVFEAGNTLLHLSINKGAKQIGMLLEAGADPELESDDGFTCLHIAIFQNKPEVVAQLIDQKVDINHCNGQGWSPIHLACYVTDPNPEIVRLLADAGARLTDTVDSGFSPLHLAASKGVPSIIAALLEFRGALDIEQHDNDGLTPLMQAVGGGNVECVRRLLQAGANINAQSAEGVTPLMYSMWLEEPDEVARLLLSQTDLDITLSSPNYGTVLHIACQTQNLAAVINLLDRGVDVNQQVPGTWPTPLMAACSPSYTSGSSRKDRLPKGYEVIRTLIDHGAEVHAMYNTVVSNAMCAAALYTGPSIIQYLISEGLSLKESNCLGRLPIHYAAANGLDNFEAVLRGDSTLLSAADSSGKTALHWAAQFGRIQTVERILAHVSSPEERKKLLNQADIDGWTALSWAIRPNYSVYIGASSELCNQTRTIQFLIESGAEVPKTCRMGQEYEVFTSLELARLHNASSEIICLLQEADSTRRTEKNMSSRSIQPYKTQRYFCDICLQDMWGPVWRCHVCLTFDVCKKCYGRIDLYHGHLTDENGEPHKFMLLHEAAPEVQEDKPSAESRASHAPSDNGTSERTHDADINPSPGSEQDSDRTENVVDQELEDIMNFSVGDYDEEDGVDGEQSP
ncbi:hypothetical protein AnigIFM50267_009101 [Aspergillus niger]|nr:hypothetical protein AnigIFM50267_009101 [Aspergillus niger]GLA16171.1 hypothetical protein AnigIFM62618_002740 [Aspergillus niger]